ncbi:MAG: endolytic transglycosylase MltG [Chromatiales bacterium]|jgi:UPF0755 protein
MNRKRTLVAALIVLAAALAAGGLWLSQENRRFVDTPLTLPDEGLLFTVEPGMPLRAVAAELERAGYLDNGLYLRLLARWREQAGRIKAGEYFIARGTTPPQLLDQLVAGRVTTYSLTVVEGWTFRQMLDALRRHEAVRHTLAGLTDEEIMARLGRSGEHPEGRFLPETYQFPRGITDLQFLRRAYAGMQRVLADAWETRSGDLPIDSPYEALVLASIVEKETGLASERARIAGVFARRLERGMRLQTDPTVIYGLGEAFDGDLRRRDLLADTPYNTYTRAGLPPTPICLPGKAAIEAVMHPAEGQSLYFVARGDGSHQFSDTLEAHNRAVRKYQLSR